MGEEKRVRREESEWRRLVEKFEAGDLSQKEFCRREGISPNTFHIWQCKLRLSRKAGGRFVEVSQGGSEAGWEVELELPHGVGLRMRK